MPHIVTIQEIADVEALGFQVTKGNIPFTDFLNEHFTGFRIGEYLKDVDDLLSPLGVTSLLKEISFHENPPPMVLVQYCSDDKIDDQTSLAFSQAFVRTESEIIADVDYLHLPINGRKKGIAKKLLNLNLQQWVQMGVTKVRLEAALSNGGLVWAKAFFSATDIQDVKTILEKARKGLQPDQFKSVERVFENYYKRFPKGKSFPMVKWSDLPGMDEILKGSYWKGELDLSNSDIFINFKNYVA